MLIAVLVLAIVDLVLMAVAIITANTILALMVIGLAAVGLWLLARDWWRERRAGDTGAVDAETGGDAHAAGHETRALEPDLFEPDLSYEDAVAEQRQNARVEKNIE